MGEIGKVDDESDKGAADSDAPRGSSNSVLGVSSPTTIPLVKRIHFRWRLQQEMDCWSVVRNLCLLGAESMPWLIAFFWALPTYGWAGFSVVLLVCSPVFFLVGREEYRKWKALPESEAFEISPERWNKAFKDMLKVWKKH